MHVVGVEGQRGKQTDKDSSKSILPHIAKSPEGVTIRKAETELPLEFKALTHLLPNPP